VKSRKNTEPKVDRGHYEVFMAKLKITQIRSTIDGKEKHKRTITALGLGKIHRTVIHNDTPQIRGMVNAVRHLVKFEEIEE